MANEIKVQTSLAVANGYDSMPRHGRQFQWDQVIPGISAPRIVADSLGIDANVLGIDAIGWLKLINVDQANHLQWGHYNGVQFFPVGYLTPGMENLIYADLGFNLHVKGVAADAMMQIIAVNR